MKFFPLLLLLSLVGCTPRAEREVREVLASMEAAAEAHDAAGVLAHVSEEFVSAQGVERRDLPTILENYFAAHPELELLVDIEELKLEGGAADADLGIRGLEIQSVSLSREAKFWVVLRREGGAWKVTRADWRLLGR